ncbi:hypothetical protein CLV58_1583 [Spirosoma oryzae]|uniref:Uncharacterized protein n=2 Tax=Spirosoma oryzae TaxID=1469603 RepID=A0A2T0RGR1_9BACT|nr:hypothetical protein CLV58_1583 [Spirosoma oryzae]
MQPYASANPQDDLLLNSLKSSLLKAYFEQLQTVARLISPDKECWDIIITFKELFWSDFRDLYSIAVGQQDELAESIVLLPENVFIIDLYSWNRLLAFAKSARRSLSDILNTVRVANSSLVTRKLLFSMHLDELIAGNQVEPLDYLKSELDLLKPQN